MLGKAIEILKDKKLKPATIMGIDSSSKSIAISLYKREADSTIVLLDVAKFKFGDKDTMRDKLEKINAWIPAFMNKYGPIDNVVIEQTIYIQSPQTSRILSYIVGHIWGKCLESCSNVIDVPIMTWKAFIGYKNVTKKDIALWTSEIGATDAKKKAAHERKYRTMKIMKEKIIGIDGINDDDVMDALAIGYWACYNV